MTVVTSCRVCGAEYEADRERILAGSWRVCSDCQSQRRPPEFPVGGRCDRCRRPLRDKRQYICVTCASVS